MKNRLLINKLIGNDKSDKWVYKCDECGGPSVTDDPTKTSICRKCGYEQLVKFKSPISTSEEDFDRVWEFTPGAVKRKTQPDDTTTKVGRVQNVTESFVEGVIDDATNFYLSVFGNQKKMEPSEENYLALKGALEAVEDKTKQYRSLTKKWIMKLDEAWEKMQEFNENQSPKRPLKPKSVVRYQNKPWTLETVTGTKASLRDKFGRRTTADTTQIQNYVDPKEEGKREIEPRSIEARRFTGVGIPDKIENEGEFKALNQSYRKIKSLLLMLDKFFKRKATKEQYKAYWSTHRPAIQNALVEIAIFTKEAESTGKLNERKRRELLNALKQATIMFTGPKVVEIFDNQIPDKEVLKQINDVRKVTQETYDKVRMLDSKLSIRKRTRQDEKEALEKYGSIQKERQSLLQNRLVNNKLVVNAGEITAFKSFLNKFEAFKEAYKKWMDGEGARSKKVQSRKTDGETYENSVILYKKLMEDWNNVKTGVLTVTEAKRIEESLFKIQLFLSNFLKVRKNSTPKGTPELRSKAGELRDFIKKDAITRFRKLLNAFTEETGKKPTSKIKQDGLFSRIIKTNTELERQVIRLTSRDSESGIPEKVPLTNFYSSVDLSKDVRNAVNKFNSGNKKEALGELTNIFQKVLNQGKRFKSRKIKKEIPELKGTNFEKVTSLLVQDSETALNYVKSISKKIEVTPKNTLEKIMEESSKPQNQRGNTMKNNMFKKRSETINYIVQNSKCNDFDKELLENLSNPVLVTIAQNMYQEDEMENMDYSEDMENMGMDNMEYNEDEDENIEVMDITSLAEKLGLDPSSDDLEMELKELLQDLLEQLDNVDSKEELDADNEEVDMEDDELENMELDLENMDLDLENEYEENMGDDYSEMMDHSENACSSKKKTMNKEKTTKEKGKKEKTTNSKKKESSKKDEEDKAVQILQNYLGSAQLPAVNGRDYPKDTSKYIKESPTLGY